MDRLDKQQEDFFRIQQYVGDYKVWFNGKMCFVSNDGVSVHASEKAFYKAVEDGTMGHYFHYKKIPSDLKEELEKRQYTQLDACAWILDTLDKTKEFKVI